MSEAAATSDNEQQPAAHQKLDKSTQTTESFMQMLRASAIAKPIPLRPHTPSTAEDDQQCSSSSFERTIVQRASTTGSGTGLTVMAVVGTQLSATTASLAELSVSSTQTHSRSGSPQPHSECTMITADYIHQCVHNLYFHTL